MPSFRAITPIGRPQSPAHIDLSNLNLGSGFGSGGSPVISRPGSQPGTPSIHTASGASPFHFGGTSGSAALAGTIGQPMFHHGNQSGANSPAGGSSPIASPRLLNAKARLFNPVPSSGAPASSGPPPGLGGMMDPWQVTTARTASPAPPGLTRTSSNLAMATPLMAASGNVVNGYLGTSEALEGTWAPRGASSPSSQSNSNSNHGSDNVSQQEGGEDLGIDDIYTSQYYRSSLVPDADDDDEDYATFGGGPNSNQGRHLPTSPASKLKLSMTAGAFDPTRLGPAAAYGSGYNSGTTTPNGTFRPSLGGGGGFFDGSAYGTLDDEYDIPSGANTPGGTPYPSGEGMGGGPDEEPFASNGMTPLDVLQSVFTSLPQGELEDALIKSNYEFEGAMAILIASNGGTKSGHSGTTTPTRNGSPAVSGMGMGGPGGGGGGPGDRDRMFRSASGHGRDRDYFRAGGRTGYSSGGAGGGFGLGGGRGPGHQSIGMNRMCRYYLAGECRRADCRFRWVAFLNCDCGGTDQNPLANKPLVS